LGLTRLNYLDIEYRTHMKQPESDFFENGSLHWSENN